MPSKPEILALHLMRTLYDSTAGRPMQWRSLAGISDGGETHEAVQLAVDRGWRADLRMVERSICIANAREWLHCITPCRLQLIRDR